jgi:tRNA modification GTPase
VTETIAACLTPPGAAALATLAVYGPRAWEVVRGAFRLPSGAELPTSPPPGRYWLGKIGEELADDVVLAVKQAEPVPHLEVHGHGGQAVLRLLLELFEKRGARICGWEEYVRHTERDALRAAAGTALAHAPTARTAAILLDQYTGALAAALGAIDEALERGETWTASALLAELAGRAELGRHLTAPWRVVIAGAPNVGKSSLANALAGYQRSIVAPTPGTTRDVVTTQLAIDGWPIELADTAGLREEGEELEEEGMRRARETAASADLTLWVMDSSTAPAWPAAEVQNVRLVVNKIDLAAAWDINQVSEAARVSAQTGEGIAELCARLGSWLVPEAPPAGAAVPFNEALAAKVGEALRQALSGEAEGARRTLRGG